MMLRHHIAALVQLASVAGPATSQSIESDLPAGTQVQPEDAANLPHSERLLHLVASDTYGDIDLDRDGLDGDTRTWLSHIQWIY